ncbi:MAG: alpha-ketoglutarate-dependent dioxygenase AlkB [Synechococcaceae cyanobacterium]|nr:alpha-ketoglutarate-dependent dioxygenase AlkB [Synechococcaceae cyanobacterium]
MTAPCPTAPGAIGEPERHEAPGLRLRRWSGWLAGHGLDSRALAAALRTGLEWQQPRITVYGRSHPVPRLQAWVGDPGCTYRYSGLLHEPQPWSAELHRLRELLAADLGCPFNSLLLNRYRNGDDRMGWHADDEPELDAIAPIASLSLGVSRTLRFRPRPVSRARPAFRSGQNAAPLALELADGDLLVMDPPTQLHWQHALPTRRRLLGERLNLTFRLIRSR